MEKTVVFLTTYSLKIGKSVCHMKSYRRRSVNIAAWYGCYSLRSWAQILIAYLIFK